MAAKRTHRIVRYECRLARAGTVAVPAGSDPAELECIEGPEPIARLTQGLTENLLHEEVWMFPLDNSLALHGAVRLAMGGRHGAAITRADVLRPLLTSGCTAFVLAHNHPSGSVYPSEADLRLTASLIQVCALLEVQFFDHVIVARRATGFCSLRQRHAALWEAWGSLVAEDDEVDQMVAVEVRRMT